MTTSEIILPHQFEPRPYQLPFFQAMDSGIKRAVLVWHRRSGKEKSCLNFVAKKMYERVGTYYYFFPEFAQGKRVIWEGIDKDGVPFLDHFPKDLIDGKPNDTEMKVKLKNGSLFQIIGTDNFNAIRGTNPVGAVFSEYSFQDPTVWDVVRPILSENGGWAVFNYTPNGKNHGYELYEMAQENPQWFSQRLTVNDTQAFPLSLIEDERKAGMSEEMIQQEYYCSFEIGSRGAYYSDVIRQAENASRITSVPHMAAKPVSTFWDLGIGDSTAIWFMQQVGHELRFVDYIEASGEAISYFAKALQERGYVYDKHYLPHDAEARELGTGKTRREMLESLGVKPVVIVPRGQVDDGINAVRMIFNQCWFDEKKCKRGLDALRNYSKDWDEKRKEFRSYPRHDWSSHGADAFRAFAMGYRERKLADRQVRRVKQADSILRMA